MAKQEANDYRRQVQALTCEVDALKGTVSVQILATVVVCKIMIQQPWMVLISESFEPRDNKEVYAVISDTSFLFVL